MEKQKNPKSIKEKKMIERNDEDYIGKFHPFPKEAPLRWRRAHWRELREQAAIKKKKREGWSGIIYKIRDIWKKITR